MRLLTLIESIPKVHLLNSVAKHRLSVGTSSYDVDLDQSDGRVSMEVLQNGMTIAELIYEDDEVVWIHVEPFFRKQGVGAAMVEFLKDQNYIVSMPDARTSDGKAFFANLEQNGRLQEAFDTTPQPLEQTMSNPTDEEFAFAANDTEYFVHFTNRYGKTSTEWEVSYGKNTGNSNTQFKPTGEGGSGTILSTVIAAIQQFLANHDETTTLQFDGNKSDKLAQLYTRMVPYLAKKLGFEYSTDEKYNRVRFIVYPQGKPT